MKGKMSFRKDGYLMPLILIAVVVAAALILTLRNQQPASTPVTEAKTESQTESVTEEAGLLYEEEAMVLIEGESETESADEISYKTKEQLTKEIEEYVKSQEGVWEVYLADEEETICKIPSRQNLSAGRLENLFLSYTAYLRVKEVHNGDYDAKIEKLISKDQDEYQESLLKALKEDKRTGTEVFLAYLDANYPETVANTTVEGAYCTSAMDAASLIKNIVEKAESGDDSSKKLVEYIGKREGTKPISGSVNLPDVDILEFYDEGETDFRDVACFSMNGKTVLSVGIIGVEITDKEKAREALGEIKDIIGQGYYFSEADVLSETEAKKEAVKTETEATTKKATEKETEKPASKTKKETQKATDKESNKETQKETEAGNTQSGAMSNMKAEIEKMIATDQFSVDLMVKDIQTGEEILLTNGESKKAEGLISLFVMETVYHQIEQGNLKESKEVKKLLGSMISENDIEACDRLVELMGSGGTDFVSGMGVVNEYLAGQGYSDTFMGGRPSDLQGSAQNKTTVKDCTALLNKVYSRTCINETYSEKMYDLLLDQQETGKIAEGIPAGILVANKSGEDSDTLNDGAIVKEPSKNGEGTTYILCIMGYNVTEKKEAAKQISKISSKVNSYFASQNK